MNQKRLRKNGYAGYQSGISQKIIPETKACLFATIEQDACAILYKWNEYHNLKVKTLFGYTPEKEPEPPEEQTTETLVTNPQDMETLESFPETEIHG